MKRLTIHVSNAKREMIKGKLKTFTTLAYEIASIEEGLSILEGKESEGINVTKYSISNIK